MLLGIGISDLKLPILVALFGGIGQFLVGSLLLNIPTEWSVIVSVLAAILALMYFAIQTGVEYLTMFKIVVLMLWIVLIGSIVALVFPIAAPFMFAPSGAITWISFGWALAWVGLAMLIDENI